jgi:hypothetical protein
VTEHAVNVNINERNNQMTTQKAIHVLESVIKEYGINRVMFDIRRVNGVVHVVFHGINAQVSHMAQHEINP